MTGSVELLFPPLYKMDAPYTALPYLLGFLDAHGVAARAVDLNISYLHYLLEDERLAEVEGELVRRHQSGDARGIERAHVAHALEHVPLLRRWLPDTLELFRAHRDPARVRALGDRAVAEETRIQLVFDLLAEIYSAHFFPFRIENLLTRREVVLTSDLWGAREVNNIAWRSQMAALRDPRNPFLAWARERVVPALAARRPRVVGLSMMFREQFLCVFTLADLLREALPGAHLCVGGTLVSDIEGYLLTSATLRDAVFSRVDSLVIGPGEVPLLALLGRLDRGDPVDDVPNVLTAQTAARPAGCASGASSGGEVPTVFLRTGREVDGRTPVVRPRYYDGDLTRYFHRGPELVLPYLASRGCYWNRCVFCKYRDQVHRYAPVPMDQLLADLAFLGEQHGTRTFHFNDEALSPSFCKRFSRAVLDAGVEVRWSGNARFDPGFTPEAVAQLRASGCQYLSFGLESGSQRIQDKIDKGIRMEVVEETMASCKAAGLPVSLYLFFGFPGETEEDLLETLRFLARHRGTYVDMSVGRFSLFQATHVLHDPARFGIRVQGDRGVDPDVLTWDHDYEVLIPGAMQREEASALYLRHHQALFGELGPCFSTDGAL